SVSQAGGQLGRAACAISNAAPTPQDVDRCRSAAERAVATGPDKPQARLAMAAYLRILPKDFDKALEQLALGLQSTPNNPDLLAASAIIERILGHFEAALVHLQQAVRVDPRWVRPLSTPARPYDDWHRFEEANAESGRALAAAPPNLGGVRGNVPNHLSQGDLAGARQVIAAGVARVGVKPILVRFATF